ncbi:predicted protein [Streptomyces lividans TK24]|nr:predicted protein [Streptomyces lividans TK24]
MADEFIPRPFPDGVRLHPASQSVKIRSTCTLLGLRSPGSQLAAGGALLGGPAVGGPARREDHRT